MRCLWAFHLGSLLALQSVCHAVAFSEYVSVSQEIRLTRCSDLEPPWSLWEIKVLLGPGWTSSLQGAGWQGRCRQCWHGAFGNTFIHSGVLMRQGMRPTCLVALLTVGFAHDL